jgi:serine/threonine protein kinase
MPDFHPDLKDLVGRMITVDPQERITIGQIKTHSAFRFMLPASYVVPTPLPFAEVCGPISADSISEDVRQLLSRIGIDGNELMESLSSGESNIVRMFVECLSRRKSLDLESLPWSEAVRELVNVELPADLDFGKGTINQKNLGPLNRKQSSSDLDLPEGFSFATKAEWIIFRDDSGPDEFDVDKTFGPMMIPLPRLMSLLQCSLVRLGFHFFHPSDVQLLGRDSTGGFVVINASVMSRDFVSWQLKLKEVQGDVEGICRQISQLDVDSILTSPDADDDIIPPD